MTNLDELEERLRDLILQDHAVTVLLKGLRGSKSLFSCVLPDVPRPGDVLSYRAKHKRGQGEYRVTCIEWIVGGSGEVVVRLAAASEARP